MIESDRREEIEQIENLLTSNVGVVIQGPSGCGKSVILSSLSKGATSSLLVDYDDFKKDLEDGENVSADKFFSFLWKAAEIDGSELPFKVPNRLTDSHQLICVDNVSDLEDTVLLLRSLVGSDAKFVVVSVDMGQELEYEGIAKIVLESPSADLASRILVSAAMPPDDDDASLLETDQIALVVEKTSGFPLTLALIGSRASHAYNAKETAKMISSSIAALEQPLTTIPPSWLQEPHLAPLHHTLSHLLEELEASPVEASNAAAVLLRNWALFPRDVSVPRETINSVAQQLMIRRGTSVADGYDMDAVRSLTRWGLLAETSEDMLRPHALIRQYIDALPAPTVTLLSLYEKVYRFGFKDFNSWSFRWCATIMSGSPKLEESLLDVNFLTNLFETLGVSEGYQVVTRALKSLSSPDAAALLAVLQKNKYILLAVTVGEESQNLRSLLAHTLSHSPAPRAAKLGADCLGTAVALVPKDSVRPSSGASNRVTVSISDLDPSLTNARIVGVWDLAILVSSDSGLTWYRQEDPDTPQVTKRQIEISGHVEPWVRARSSPYVTFTTVDESKRWITVVNMEEGELHHQILISKSSDTNRLLVDSSLDGSLVYHFGDEFVSAKIVKCYARQSADEMDSFEVTLPEAFCRCLGDYFATKDGFGVKCASENDTLSVLNRESRSFDSISISGNLRAVTCRPDGLMLVSTDISTSGYTPDSDGGFSQEFEGAHDNYVTVLRFVSANDEDMMCIESYDDDLNSFRTFDNSTVIGVCTLPDGVNPLGCDRKGRLVAASQMAVYYYTTQRPVISEDDKLMWISADEQYKVLSSGSEFYLQKAGDAEKISICDEIESSETQFDLLDVCPGEDHIFAFVIQEDLRLVHVHLSAKTVTELPVPYNPSDPDTMKIFYSPDFNPDNDTLVYIHAATYDLIHVPLARPEQIVRYACKNKTEDLESLALTDAYGVDNDDLVYDPPTEAVLETGRPVTTYTQNGSVNEDVTFSGASTVLYAHGNEIQIKGDQSDDKTLYEFSATGRSTYFRGQPSRDYYLLFNNPDTIYLVDAARGQHWVLVGSELDPRYTFATDRGIYSMVNGQPISYTLGGDASLTTTPRPRILVTEEVRAQRAKEAAALRAMEESESSDAALRSDDE